MKIITESEMKFGKFDEKNLFHIEESQIYKKLGTGIKTVEFVLKYRQNKLIFLEAKKSCPNAQNKDETEVKKQKFEEYYSSITGKFISSLQIYLAAILDRFEDATEIGSMMRSANNIKDMQLKFVLVVKDAKDIAWLAKPQAELNERLLQFRKIWNIQVIVLNEELARERGLIC